MPFPDPNAAARTAPPWGAKKKYKDWREEGNDLASQLENYGKGLADDLTYHPYQPTERFAYRDNNGKLALVSPSKEHVFVPEAEAQSYVNKGWMPESPTEYWERQRGEKTKADIGGAGFESFAKGAVSGLTLGGSDMLERYGYSDKVMREGDDPSNPMTDLQRAAAVQEEHGGAGTFGAIAGSTVSLLYGGAGSVAARAGRAVGGAASKAMGFTARAERAAALATAEAEKAAQKSVVNELTFYKNLPANEAEKAAARAQAAADAAEVRGAFVAGREATIAEQAARGVGEAPAGWTGGGLVDDVASRGSREAASDITRQVELAEQMASGVPAAKVSAGEAAAARVVEEAVAAPTTAMVAPEARALARVDEVTSASMQDLFVRYQGPSRKGRLTPAAGKKMVDALALPEAEKGMLKEALDIERKLQSRSTHYRDNVAPIFEKMSHAKPVTEAEGATFREYMHSMERIKERLAKLYEGRAAANSTPSGPMMRDIFDSFMTGPAAKLPELPAAAAVAETKVAKAAKVVEEAQAARSVVPLEDDAMRAALGAPARLRGKALAGTPSAAKSEVRAALQAELDDAVSTGRMPDFLQTRAGAPLGPVGPGYTAARGEAWLAGEGAQKTSSRVTPGERWSPGSDWSIPKGAPRFPGQAPAVEASTRADDVARYIGGTMARGGAEGGMYAGGRELSRQALSGSDYDPGAVAAHAIEGAALGSLVSLAGAGISSVAGRAASGLKRAVAGRAGVDTTRLEILLARQRIMKARLEHLYESPTRQANVLALESIKKEIFQARAQVFEAGGQLLKSLSIPLGAVGGIGSGSLVGMLLGHAGAHGAASILTSGIVKRAGVAVGRAAGATLKAVPTKTLGKMAGLAIVGTMTAEEVDALQVELEITDAKEVGLAALQGYQQAGIDPGMATFLADYQSKRVHLLKLAFDSASANSTGRVVASRVFDAVEDPRRAVERLSKGDVRSEDLLVIQNLFPDFYRDITRQSIAMLKKRGLTARQKLDLMKIAGNATYPITTNAIQTALVPQGNEEQPGRRGGKIENNAATESQRIQGGI